jgi:thiol-disulfide isomerase/thioredoxin
MEATMALTPSRMVPLGTKALDFKLPDTISGKILSLEQLKSSKGTVIMFICNHCPFVQHIQTKLAEVAKNYQNKGIGFIAINSNDIENYPEDAPDKMKEVALRLHYVFPYLFDATQAVAKAYGAECTPDFFVYNDKLELYYRGQFDSSSPGKQTPVTGEALTNTLDALLAQKPAPENQKPSIVFNIKWKY